MKGDMLTLFYPAGDGVRQSSNQATYKGIKDFKTNGNGTITFNTRKHGEITTPLLWRLKKNVELGNDDDAEEAPVAKAPAGQNAPHVGGGHW